MGHDAYTGSVDQPYQYVGQLGYYTHVQDENMDLLQLGVRFYDPEVGGFTQVDPAKDGGNWYAYVEGAPLTYTDPSGETRGGSQNVGRGGDPCWQIIKDMLCEKKTKKEIIKRLVEEGMSKEQAAKKYKQCAAYWGEANKAKRGGSRLGGRKGCGGIAEDSATACFEQDPVEFMWLICGDEWTSPCSVGYAPPRDVIGDAKRQIGDWWDRTKENIRRIWPF